ncbi:MAG: ribosomal protein S18-alanine N-acetyltransferase [Oceanicoccus sp.]
MLVQDLDAVVVIEAAVTEFPWPRTQFSESLAGKDNCSVVMVDQQVCGFSIFSSVLDESTLLNIAVTPSMQGQRLGRKMLQQGLDNQKRQGIAKCFLEVRLSNIAAQALYYSLGFINIGERKNYYPANGGRENALVMCKDFSQSPIAIA